jgi:hypothetical protein
MRVEDVCVLFRVKHHLGTLVIKKDFKFIFIACMFIVSLPQAARAWCTLAVATIAKSHEVRCVVTPYEKNITNQHIHPYVWKFVHRPPRYASVIIYHCIMVLQLRFDLLCWIYNSQCFVIFYSEFSLWILCCLCNIWTINIHNKFYLTVRYLIFTWWWPWDSQNM